MPIGVRFDATAFADTKSSRKSADNEQVIQIDAVANHPGSREAASSGDPAPAQFKLLEEHDEPGRRYRKP